MKNIIKREKTHALTSIVVKTILFLILLQLVYSAFMIATFAIPNQRIEPKVQMAKRLLKNENSYRNFGDTGSSLDNFTDSLMLQKADEPKAGIIFNAFDIQNYARYWHGYLVILRPILYFMGYTMIRQLYAVVLTLLLVFLIILTYKKLNIFFAVALAVSLVFQRFQIMWASMQYSNVFIVAMIASIALLYTIKKIKYQKESLVFFFLAIGSVTNFLDLLTAPLVSLGMPLILLLCYNMMNKRSNFLKNMKTSIIASLAWAMGYSVTWGAKWIIGSIVLKRNIVTDAFSAILFRTEGNSQYPLHRSTMYLYNLKIEYSPVNLLTIFIITLVWLVTYCVLSLKVKSFFKLIDSEVLSFLLIALIPFIWYTILAGHSEIHCWMTYRELFLLTFSYFAYLSYIYSNLLQNYHLKKQSVEVDRTN